MLTFTLHKPFALMIMPETLLLTETAPYNLSIKDYYLTVTCCHFRSLLLILLITMYLNYISILNFLILHVFFLPYADLVLQSIIMITFLYTPPDSISCSLLHFLICLFSWSLSLHLGFVCLFVCLFLNPHSLLWWYQVVSWLSIICKLKPQFTSLVWTFLTPD